MVLFQVGILTSIVEELESLINVNDSRNSGLDPEMETRMEIDMHRTKEALERADKELAEKNEELKARAELIIDLTAKVPKFTTTEMKDIGRRCLINSFWFCSWR